jgi:hypothetical protein
VLGITGLNQIILESICDLGRSNFEAAKVALTGEMTGHDLSSIAATAAGLVSEYIGRPDFGSIACLIYLMAVSGSDDVSVSLGRQALDAHVDDERIIVALADALHRRKDGNTEFFDVLLSFYNDRRSTTYKRKLSDYSHDAGYAFLSERYMQGWIASDHREFIPLLAEFWGVTRDWRSVSDLLNGVEFASAWGNPAVYVYGRSAVAHFDENNVVKAIRHLANSGGGDLADLLADVWRWRIGTPLAKRVWSVENPSRVAERDLTQLVKVDWDSRRLPSAMCPPLRLTGMRTTTVDALLIGTQRAGTSWLWSMIMQNPNVHQIGFKEPVFFSDCFTDIGGFPEELRRGTFTEDDQRYWEGPTRSLDDYMRLFEQTGRVRIDASPTYVELPDVAVERASDVLGRKTKIILLVRDPVERAWSNFCYDIMAADRPPTSFDFEQRTAHYRTAASMRRGSYAEIIDRWDAHFDEVRTFVFDDVVERPTEVLRNVCTLLGLQVSERSPHQPAINGSGKHVMPREDRSFLLGLYAQEYDKLTSRLGGWPVEWRNRHLSVLGE